MVAFQFYFLTEGVRWLYYTLLYGMNNCDYIVNRLYSISMFLKYDIYHASEIYLLYVVNKIVNVIFNRISIDILSKLYV